MCGIAGLISNSTTTIAKETINCFLNKLEHRGPDDQGMLIFNQNNIKRGKLALEDTEAEVILLHRRLSILDLSDAGSQPMSSLDGCYHIVFNGEIYNYIELRSELQNEGYTFHSHSDTEVLLCAYRHWGVDCLNRLVGMFAFAILDTQKRQVFLARDFFGIKPLYYTFWQGGFAFSSEIPPLLELSGVSRSVNPQTLHNYLRFGITDRGQDTLFADIKQLASAFYVEIQLDYPKVFEPVCYWQVDLNQPIEISFEDASHQLRELFLNNVKLHLRSDVPVGTALSGGIDSSAIVMAMRYLEPNLDLHTFSYIADDPLLSEECYIDIIGKSANAIMHKIQPSSEELLADLKHLIEVQGEPFGNTSIYAQHCVFRLASEAGIKVMLDGQGADEILGGYFSYKGARLASLLRQQQWKKAYQFSRTASAIPGMGSLLLTQWTISYILSPRIQIVGRRLAGKDLTPSWLNRSWFQKHQTIPMLFDYTQSYAILRESLLDSVTNTLPCLLRFEDRNSMAFSIESRVPFLTPALVSFMLNLPDDYIIAPDGMSKSVFRSAMKGIVPDSVLQRKDKIGFATTESQWLMALKEWVDTVLDSEVAKETPVLNLEQLKHDWNLCLQGRKSYQTNIWKAINLIEWTRQFAIKYF